MSTVPPIWKALIDRDIQKMTNILTKDPTQANTPHPRSLELLLDSSLYWGYLPESKLLFSFGASHKNSPLGSSLNLGNQEQLQWTYDNLDQNLSDPTLPDACFASTLTKDDVKYNSFKFEHSDLQFNIYIDVVYIFLYFSNNSGIVLFNLFGVKHYLLYHYFFLDLILFLNHENIFY